MKNKIKIRMVATLLAIAILSVCTIALAEDYDYSATKCKNYFTTSGSVTKESYNQWDYVLVVAGENGITFTPSLPSGSIVRQQVRSIGGSNVTLGNPVFVRPGFTGSAMGGWYGVPVTDSRSDNYNTMRVRIINPYGSGYNMQTYGTVRVNWC